VARIVEGLTPTQRARFVFQAPPNNFQDFEQLVVLDRNITYANQTRKIPAATVRADAVETHATKSTPFAVLFPSRAGSPLLGLWTINEHRYNRGRVPQPFQVGDLVYYKNHPISHAGRRIAAKLMPRYKGPFKVDRFLTPVTVRLVMPTTGQFVTRAHVSLLKGGVVQRD
jgi:hypothetical protein